jgi:hypothetical protein
MANTKHAFDKSLLKLHERTGSTGGGACLTRHVSNVTTSSCSHRWQARERAATNDSAWYNGIVSPRWDVVDGNFDGKCRKPYYHQAHHIVPNRVLAGCIYKAAEESASFTLYKLIRMGLLEAKYNLNHKDNMIILPMGKYVAKRLKLPRHLSAGARAHDDYSDKVKKKVKKVIDEYKELVKKSVPECDKPPPAKLAKKNLETVSTKMRNAIRAWGVLTAPKTLDEMTEEHFAEHYK